MTPQSSQHHFRKLLQAGGQAVKVSVFGKYVHFSESYGSALPFEMRFDDLPWFPANMGLRFTLPGGDTYKELHFRNPNAKDITIEFYCGTVETADSRLSIVRGRLVGVMHGPSVWTAHSQTIGAGATVDLTAAHPVFPTYLRKATIVTNMDPAVDLEILDADDAVLDTVLFRSTKLYESSSGIQIKNNTAAPVVCRANQIWYVTEVE